MSQTQTILQILHRTEKSALSMIEKALSGAIMEPQVAAVYERKKASVAELEKRLGKGKAASK